MSAPNTCDREQQQQGIWTSPAASSPRYSTSPLAPIIEASCCSGGNSSFVPCCICLDIHSKDNTILRPECFHRFCRTCANKNDYIQLWKSNKCPACQKDLDETVSDDLLLVGMNGLMLTVGCWRLSQFYQYFMICQFWILFLASLFLVLIHIITIVTLILAIRCFAESTAAATIQRTKW